MESPFRMKQNMLGYPIGRAALFLRDKLDLLRGAYFSTEAIGTIANDQLATTLITKICGSGKSFVDVGAHIGSIIALVRHNDPSIKIVAIEAIPQKVLDLRRRFPFVELHGCAVGETTGEIPFFIDTKRSGYSSLARPTEIDQKAKLQIMVPIDKLDNLVKAADVDAIKIDVEGAELGVLRGALDILGRCRPIVMFESGPSANDGLGYTKDDMLDFFDSMGFAVVVPNRVAHNDEGLSTAGFVESHLYPRRTTNYFAIPRERRIEFRDRARQILRI
jgi:FkbM family methyltransferase